MKNYRKFSLKERSPQELFIGPRRKAKRGTSERYVRKSRAIEGASRISDETGELRVFIDAIRGCLDLEPLYATEREMYDGPAIYHRCWCSNGTRYQEL